MLLTLARTLPESKAYRATSRAGWTLKHELSSLAAADDELVHVLEEVRRRAGPLAIALRRRRGETMHRVQQLRLRPLLDELEAGGTRAAAALREHGHHLEHSAWAEGSADGAGAEQHGRDLLHAYMERARSAGAAVHAAIEG